jgi:predicted XRE-type DNA-binding protein
MKKRDKIPVFEGSGNVFADLGLPNAAELSLKAELTRQIINRVKALDLNQSQAAKRLGLGQPDLSRLMRGRHTGFSGDRLLALLNLLEVDVEIVLRPQQHPRTAKGSIKVREAA